MALSCPIRPSAAEIALGEEGALVLPTSHRDTDHGGMVERRSLSTLLSQALVAFTIEFDNEAEHRISHRTTVGGRSGGPRGAVWLVSQVMWVNVMRFVPEEGVRVDELHRSARTTKDSLTGLQRWRYVTVSPDADGRAGQAVVRPTAAGSRAQEVWRPLASLIEQRWRSRLGSEELDRLRSALEGVVDRLDTALPDYLPIVYPTQNGRAEIPDPAWAGPDSVAEWRRSGPVRPAVPGAVGLHHRFRAGVQDLAGHQRQHPAGPRPTGGPPAGSAPSDRRVQGGNAMAVGFLERRECAVVEPDPSAVRGKVVRLTPKGVRAVEKYRRILVDTERQWSERFGADSIVGLRDALEGLVDGPDGSLPPLRLGLQPYPDGWRASVREPETLPHYPMVLHRGGYPDGS